MTFWVLLVTAVLAIGGLSRSLDRGGAVGIVLAGVAGSVAAIALFLVLRILVVLKRGPRPEGTSPGGGAAAA